MRILEFKSEAPASLAWLVAERLGKVKGDKLSLAQLKIVDAISEVCQKTMHGSPIDDKRQQHWRIAEFAGTDPCSITLEEAEFDFLKDLLTNDGGFDFGIFRAFGDPEDAKATRRAVFELVDVLKASTKE